MRAANAPCAWHARLVSDQTRPVPEWRDVDSHFDAGEPGWSSGCRPEDRSWVDAYGFLDYSRPISNPVDALPAGYPAYTAVLHHLEHPDTERRVRWITDAQRDPWEQVQAIVDHGLFGDPSASDVALAQPEGAFLADVLDLDATIVPLTVTFFFVPWVGTVTPALLAERLRTIDFDLDNCPTFWFPHTRAWVASTPYDGGWTFIASDVEIARRLRSNPDIEALACTYHR